MHKKQSEEIMELRNKTQSKSSYSIRQKLKRIISMTLSVLMVISVIDYTGLVNVNAQTQSDVKIVTAFAELPEDIYNQQISQGSSETDVSLPNTLNVTVKSIIEKNTNTGGENAENIEQGVPELIVDETAVESTEESTDTNSEINMEERQNTVNSEESSAETADDSTLENEVQNNELDQQETVEIVTIESVENYAEPPAQNVETVVKNMTEEGTDQTATSTVREVLEDITIENISWKLNASASSTGSFDSAFAGGVYFYEPVLPEDYVLAEGISLPQIRVEIVEKEDNVQSFEKSLTIDGIVITVSAEAGVFPEEAMLTVKKIVDSNEQNKIEEAVKEEIKAEETTKTVEQLISFDITITDIEDNELQPDTSKGEVTVSFAQLPMLSDVASPVQELKVFHMDESFNEATGLDTTVNQETESVEATAEHFSVYTVAQLTDEIRANVEAMVISANGEEIYYCDTLDEATTKAFELDHCTVKLMKDIDRGDRTVTILSGKTMTIDTNEHTLNFHIGDEEKGILVEEGATFTLQGNSSESASIRGTPAIRSTTKSWGYWTILIYSRGTCTIESAYLEGNDGPSRGVITEGGSLTVKNSTIKGGGYSIYNYSGEVFFDGSTTLEGQLSLYGRATLNSLASMTVNTNTNNDWFGYFNTFCVNGTIGGDFTWNPNMTENSKLITTEFVADDIQITDSKGNTFPVLYTGNTIEIKIKIETATKTIVDSKGEAKTVTLDTSPYTQTFETQGTDGSWSEVDEVKDAGTYRVKYVYGDKIITKEFMVTSVELSGATAVLNVPEGGYTYDKTAKTPAVTLTLDGYTLVLGTDYILDYMDNTDAGTASVTITGQGNYTGTKNIDFTIAKATPNITLEVKGTGVNDEIVYGSAVTYTVRVTGVGGVTLTDATIVGVDVNANNPAGNVMEYNTEKDAYFISQTEFRTERPGTYPFHATAVFREGSDTDKNYILGEDNKIISASISKIVQKADTSIAFNPSYAENYYYTGGPVSNPVEADLNITGASYSNVVFTWYDQTSTKLDTPPTVPGSYILAVSIPENDYFKPSSNTKPVTISSYDGAVTFAYNGSNTKALWYTEDVQISADGYTVSDSADGTFSSSYLLSREGAVNKTLYFKQNGTGYITEGKDIEVKIDKTTPVFSDEGNGIKIDTNHWKTFLNTITFGKFFNATKDVSISATDSISGISKYYYYVDTTGTTTIKTAEELNSVSFTEGNSFSIEDDNKYVIYAYAVDAAGNKSAYICTDGIVIDKTAPAVTLTAPAGSDLKDVTGKAKVQMNETGTITYVISTVDDIEMSPQNILDDATKKTLSVTASQTGTELDIPISGLTANTTYFMYLFGTDTAGNQSNMRIRSFTTTKTQPVFNENPTITGIYGQQAKNMTISQKASTNGIVGNWSVSNTDIPSVGTTATYDVVFTPDNVEKYATVTVQVTPTVNPRSLTAEGVTIGEVTGTHTYDQMAKEPTVTVIDSEAIITASDYDFSYSNNINAGTATVTITTKGNYTGSVSRTFTIEKAPAPSITHPTASSIFYGQKLSASAISFSSTEYGTFAWTNGNVVPTVSNSGYEVTFTPNANTVANYEAITGTTHTVAITVSKATPAVTISTDISDDAGSPKVTLTATVTGAGDGETPAGTVKFVNSTSGGDEDIAGATAVIITGGKATYTWTGLASQIYKVKAVYSGSENYNTATSTELNFDTNKQNQAALSIGSIGTKTYGDGTFTLSAAGGSGGGAVTFESADPTIVSISGTTAKIHKAGTVTITATKAVDNTYNEAKASASLTVGKKTLTVKANDHLNMIKDAAMPELTYTVTGLVDSDTFTNPTISTTVTNTNTLGEYDIFISNGALVNADSYAVTYINGKMTVVKAVYNVSVSGGTGSGTYSKGQTVTITADTRNGYTFTGWSSSDGVTFANSKASVTSFTMPGKAVTIVANHTKNSNGDSGDSNGGTTSITTAINNDNSNNNASTTPGKMNQAEMLAAVSNIPIRGDVSRNTPIQQNRIILGSQTTQPYLAGQEEKSGWEAIMTELEVTSEEEGEELSAITVQMNGVTTIPADVITSLRGKNRNLIFDMGDGVTWTINGMDITDTQLIDMNLGVTKNTSIIPDELVNGIRGANNSIQIELAHNGAFGFEATLTISFDEEEAGKYANLFYYNEETGELEYMESVKVGKDGTALLSFVHASAYTIVLSNETMDESTAVSVKGTANQTSNNEKSDVNEVRATEESFGSIIIILLILSAISIVVIAGTTIYIKKQKFESEDYEG